MVDRPLQYGRPSNGLADRKPGNQVNRPFKLLFGLVALCWSCVALAGCNRAPAPTLTSDVIVYGQTVQGSLTGGEHHWLFIGGRGDTITIRLTVSGDMPPITLLDPVGTAIARFPASLGVLERFKLLTSGQYAIAAIGGSGQYTLDLRLVVAGDQTPTASPTPSPPPASSRTLGLGESRTGTLQTGDAQDLWALAGQAGAVITIRMDATAGEIDPSLRLFAPDGSLVAGDEDSGGGRNALIAGVRLPVTGTYLIRAAGSGRIGDYVLSAEPGLPPPSPTPTATPVLPTPGPSPTPTITPTVIEVAQNGAQIRIGQTIQGTIASPDQVDRFVVFGAAGAVISVGMFPAEDSRLVPSLIMYAPNGDQVGTAAGATGAIIAGYTLPVTGAYVLYVRGWRGESIGAYTLTAGDGLTLRNLDGGPVVAGTPSPGKLLRRGDRETWSLDLPANATIAVEVAPGQGKLDTLVEVVGPDGKVLATAQANPATHVAKIAAATTTLQGRHLIRVSAARMGNIGAYTLLARVVKIAPTATFSGIFDQTFVEDLDEGQRFTHSFQGMPGEVVLVEAHARVPNGFDPVIELYGPSGRRLAVVDDISADNTDAILQIALDDGAGTYTVLVYGYAMTPGAFTVRIKTG
jgi:hypothetical protein